MLRNFKIRPRLLLGFGLLMLMTAALVAHWVEQGKLRWDSRPTDLLPEAAAKQHPAYANATLAQLLDELGLLRTERHYENFELELEWRHLTPGGNAERTTCAAPPR